MAANEFGSEVVVTLDYQRSMTPSRSQTRLKHPQLIVVLINRADVAFLGYRRKATFVTVGMCVADNVR